MIIDFPMHASSYYNIFTLNYTLQKGCVLSTVRQMQTNFTLKSWRFVSKLAKVTSCCLVHLFLLESPIMGMQCKKYLLETRLSWILSIRTLNLKSLNILRYLFSFFFFSFLPFVCFFRNVYHQLVRNYFLEQKFFINTEQYSEVASKVH